MTRSWIGAALAAVLGLACAQAAMAAPLRSVETAGASPAFTDVSAAKAKKAKPAKKAKAAKPARSGGGSGSSGPGMGTDTPDRGAGGY
jgi:hypothetical protein